MKSTNQPLPFKVPYKATPSEELKKLQELEKQLHFLEARVASLESEFVDANGIIDEDYEEDLSSEPDEDVSEICDPLLKKRKF